MNNEYDTVGDPNGPQRSRHGSPTFYKFLAEMAETHDAKSHDYASDDKPFANYEFAGNMAIMFSHNAIDAGFSGRLAEKLYRLYVLESSGKIPKNESISDTERDIAVIATLWMAARKDKQKEANKVKSLADEQEAYILAEKLKYQGISGNAVMGGLRWDREQIAADEINKEAAAPDMKSEAAVPEIVELYLSEIKSRLNYKQQYEIFTNLGQYLLKNEDAPRRPVR